MVLIDNTRPGEGGITMHQKNLADLYGLDPIPWSRALEALESGKQRNDTSFLATTRPDGRPHVAGVGAVWDSGKVYFVSGAGTRSAIAARRRRRTSARCPCRR